jgi:hypothetical protein
MRVGMPFIAKLIAALACTSQAKRMRFEGGHVTTPLQFCPPFEGQSSGHGEVRAEFGDVGARRGALLAMRRRSTSSTHAVRLGTAGIVSSPIGKCCSYGCYARRIATARPYVEFPWSDNPNSFSHHKLFRLCLVFLRLTLAAISHTTRNGRTINSHHPEGQGDCSACRHTHSYADRAAFEEGEGDTFKRCAGGQYRGSRSHRRRYACEQQCHAGWR